MDGFETNSSIVSYFSLFIVPLTLTVGVRPRAENIAQIEMETNLDFKFCNRFSMLNRVPDILLTRYQNEVGRTVNDDSSLNQQCPIICIKFSMQLRPVQTSSFITSQ